MKIGLLLVLLFLLVMFPVFGMVENSLTGTSFQEEKVGVSGEIMEQSMYIDLFQEYPELVSDQVVMNECVNRAPTIARYVGFHSSYALIPVLGYTNIYTDDGWEVGVTVSRDAGGVISQEIQLLI